MKKTISINGRVLLPLKEGCRATIIAGDHTMVTSPIVDVIELTHDRAYFETMNSIYIVSLMPNRFKSALTNMMLMSA